MSLDRGPARAAVRRRMQEWSTNAIAVNAIWQFVNLALDAIEEQLAQAVAHRNEFWVIEYHPGGKDLRGTILSVCTTRARARRRLKKLMLVVDSYRYNFTIHRVPGGE